MSDAVFAATIVAIAAAQLLWLRMWVRVEVDRAIARERLRTHGEVRIAVATAISARDHEARDSISQLVRQIAANRAPSLSETAE